MKSARETVDYYFTMFRSGRETDAFHGLIESDHDIVLELIAAYDGATETNLRDFIIRVVSELRRPSSLSFLKQELLSTTPEIWKRALDGLCMCKNFDSVHAMTEAIPKITDQEKKEWVLEAIRNTTLAIKKRAGQAEDTKP